MEKRKEFLKQLLFLLLILACACIVEDDYTKFDKVKFREESREWFENSITAPIEIKISDDDEGTLVVPEWKYPSVTKKDEWATLEVPVLADRYSGVIDPKCVEMFEATEDIRYMETITRIVVRKNMITNKTDGFLMSISPSLDYLESTDFKPFLYMSYLQRDENFTGTIIFRTLKGELISSWLYRDGEVLLLSSKTESDGNELRSSISGCTDIYTNYVTTEKVGEMIEGVFTLTIIRTHHLVYLFTDCGIMGNGLVPLDLDIQFGSGSPKGYGKANKAKQLFKNNPKISDADWEKFEKIIEDMDDDCAGKALFDALIGKTFDFNGFSSTKEGETVRDDDGHFGISIKDDNDADSHLFHEMLHLLQYSTSGNESKSHVMNYEIEAWYADYLYRTRQGDYSSTWKKTYSDTEPYKTIAKINKYIDAKGNMLKKRSDFELDLYLQNNVFGIFKYTSYKNYNYDYDLSGANNFKFLKTISKNC
jgi:hypothetical protein